MTTKRVTYDGKEWDVICKETRAATPDRICLHLRPLPTPEPKAEQRERWPQTRTALTYFRKRQFVEWAKVCTFEEESGMICELTALLETAEKFRILSINHGNTMEEVEELNGRVETLSAANDVIGKECDEWKQKYYDLICKTESEQPRSLESEVEESHATDCYPYWPRTLEQEVLEVLRHDFDWSHSVGLGDQVAALCRVLQRRPR